MKEIFFYTTHTPHKWSSGPTTHDWDTERGRMIESLERAKELAEQNRLFSYGDERVDTMYGVMYETGN